MLRVKMMIPLPESGNMSDDCDRNCNNSLIWHCHGLLMISNQPCITYFKTGNNNRYISGLQIPPPHAESDLPAARQSKINYTQSRGNTRSSRLKRELIILEFAAHTSTFLFLIFNEICFCLKLPLRCHY